MYILKTVLLLLYVQCQSHSHAILFLYYIFICLLYLPDSRFSLPSSILVCLFVFFSHISYTFSYHILFVCLYRISFQSFPLFPYLVSPLLIVPKKLFTSSSVTTFPCSANGLKNSRNFALILSYPCIVSIACFLGKECIASAALMSK